MVANFANYSCRNSCAFGCALLCRLQDAEKTGRFSRADGGDETNAIHDKKKMKLKDANLPDMVLQQTPKYMRRMKMPFVKAKVGPRIMTLIADPKVYDILPVKKEVKAVISGIYITELKSVRGGAIPAPPKKKGFFARFKKDKTDKTAKDTNSGKSDKTDSKGKKNK